MTLLFCPAFRGPLQTAAIYLFAPCILTNLDPENLRLISPACYSLSVCIVTTFLTFLGDVVTVRLGVVFSLVHFSRLFFLQLYKNGWLVSFSFSFPVYFFFSFVILLELCVIWIYDMLGSFLLFVFFFFFFSCIISSLCYLVRISFCL